MHATKAIMTAAVLIVAVFAGLSIVADDSEGATDNTVTYIMGGASLPVKATGGVVVLYGPEDVKDFYTAPEGEVFDYWTDLTPEEQNKGEKPGTVYKFGATITVPANGLDLYPHISEVTTATFIVDGKTFVSDETLAIPAEAKAATVKEGYAFDGWLKTGEKVPVATDKLTVKAGDVYTAVFHQSFDIVWIVDGITIATSTTEDLATTTPAEPKKENYDFEGWYDAAGVKYTEKTETSEGYVFTADTTFTAKFVPVNLTVTFTADGAVVSTVLVPYGSTVVMPALPAGFEAWEFDFSTPITADTTITAKKAAEPVPEPVTVTFLIETTKYGPYEVSDRFSIPNTDREGFTFAGWLLAGGDGTKLTNEQVTKMISEADESLVFTATYDVVVPAAPAEPGFFETPVGLTVAILVVIVIGALVAILVLKKDSIPFTIAKKDKGDKGGDGQA